ncbi:MAG: diacylglycerol O-acyltransferase / wax synthase [Rhodospirillaceae bacterium]|jgi:WS/DGAT/MGAT family acyltransferase|nr:diacylglycerol O-acyltransferase / wax synthase [Rhodospirillaceae bacterium]
MDQQQLSGIDASFLYLETPETPMHVAGLTYFQLPEGFEGSFYRHFRRFFESRLHTIPIFSKRLAPSLYDLDHPGWVDALDLDLDYHLRETALPAPGTEAQLEQVIGRLHANTLDRSRPLWQFYVITGLENGQGVLYSKVHHAAIDGGAGMAINKALYDVTAVPREVAPPPPKPAAPKPAPSSPTAVDPVKGIADIMGNMMRQQLKMWEAAPAIVNAMTDAFLAKPGEMPKALGTLQSLVTQLPTLDAPKTPFNATITRERSYAARTISLGDAKAIAKAGGAKLNDVVMAVCSGALRRYLQEKGQLPDKPLIAGVPISLREPGDTRQNNQVSGMLCQIATDIADPAERLTAIVRSSSQAKQLAGTFRDAVPQDFAFVGAPILLQLVMLVYGRSGLADRLPMPMNVTISNVPGPPMPLYCAGAKVTALHPVSIAAHGAALNITVQSYMDALNFGLTADRRAVPDVGRLGDYLVEAADELKKAVVAG